MNARAPARSREEAPQMVKERIARQDLDMYVTPCPAAHHPTVQCAPHSHHRVNDGKPKPGTGHAVGENRQTKNKRTTVLRQRKLGTKMVVVRGGYLRGYSKLVWMSCLPAVPNVDNAKQWRSHPVPSRALSVPLERRNAALERSELRRSVRAQSRLREGRRQQRTE